MTEHGTVIVGAGIIGSLVAREVSLRAPGAPVTLVDRDMAGSGATRRSAGLHLPRGSTGRTREMSAYSHAYYADMKRHRPELPMYPVAATVHADSREQIDRYLPQAAPRQLTSTSWRLSGSHHADVYRLTQMLVAQLRTRVAVAEGVRVTGLEPASDAVVLRMGTRPHLTADRVVLAPGPWLNDPAWRELIVPLGLRVKRIVALHIAREPDLDDEVIVFDNDDAFLLPLAYRGHWLFSYTCREWDVDPDEPPSGLTQAHLDEARDCLRRHHPAMADAIEGGRTFCDAYSPDGAPVITTLDPAGRVVFAGAACGSGYRLAPAIAAEAAEKLGSSHDPQHVRRGRAAPLVRN